MPQSAVEYLAAHELLTLATASRSGTPHAAPMFYVNEGPAVYFSAAPGSRTAANLTENPVASIGVSDRPADWSQARGLQMDGTVTELDGPEETHAAELFGKRFPHLGDAVNHTHYWRLDPSDIRYVHNNERGDEQLEALGVTWERESVQADS
jgi:nitroimidazol reductase NimA-like FMN-containing flavoprotein (pyridoxamine 5'-phosphate oxidase superfamily)